MNTYDRIIRTLLNSGAHIAVQYVSPKECIRATRTWYTRWGFPKRDIEIRLSHGRPNYLERHFIKQAKKAGEPFPIRKIQLKFPPKKKKKGRK